MTTLMLALPLSNPIRGPVKKRRVLLVDTSTSKRELRAETMRRLGMDVDCAADISEARSWWRADLSASAARSMAMRNRPSPPRDVEARYSKPAPAESQILPELQKEEMQ